MQLKDFIDDKLKDTPKQEKKYIWEDVTETGNWNAQGGEVYYRDYQNNKTCAYGAMVWKEFFSIPISFEH